MDEKQGVHEKKFSWLHGIAAPYESVCHVPRLYCPLPKDFPEEENNAIEV